ncbi:MAG: pyridoxamine 5'-phosphate oxidase family protein [Actinobacteria bacterium]|nr:pyridoxamine 5'-phosphate oxidase family protein [Actinomycetota bacterium]
MTDAPSPRTQVRRHPERAAYDRGAIDAILDDALICHLAWVTPDGFPRIVPTIHVRVGDTLYVHGSEASRTLRALGSGAQVCVEATLIDGLVLARSTPLHSMNYRSVVVYGSARDVADPGERDLAQRALVEHVIPGRTAEVRMPTDKELKETAILAIGLDESSAKIRTGPPKDPDEDLALDVWAGVLPVRMTAGEPEPSPDLGPDIGVPAYVTGYRRSGRGVTA